jgi:hypothetical protein
VLYFIDNFFLVIMKFNCGGKHTNSCNILGLFPLHTCLVLLNLRKYVCKIDPNFSKQAHQGGASACCPGEDLSP